MGRNTSRQQVLRIIRLLERLADLNAVGHGTGEGRTDRSHRLRDDLIVLRVTLQRLLASLNDRDRHIVDRLGYQGASRATLAFELGTTPGALRSRLYKIARHLIKGGFSL